MMKAESNPTIHRLVERQAQKTPAAPALRLNEHTLTYQVLNRHANQLSHHLRAHGVGPEVFVGVCLKRSFELVATLLAILKAGGAYVPLDPTYPPARLAYILADSQVPVVITDPDLGPQLPAYHGTTILISDDVSRYPTHDPTPLATSNNAAYMLYTSGSTGQPKGVMGTHCVAVNRLSHELFPITADEVFCVKTSFNFIDVIWEIFMPLSCGLSTVIIPEGILTDPPLLVQTLARHRVTRLVFVPSFLTLLLDSGLDLATHLSAIKYWISSGEAISLDLAHRFKQALPHATLVNLYGTSETWDVTWHPFNPDDNLSRVPVGQVIPGMEVHVLNEHLQPVPHGTEGELYVGGVGLARGYYNRPRMTAERFVPSPFTEGARLFKTGDLARYTPEHGLDYLGRLDHQVKLRGIRIELGEIEAALMQHPDIRQTVVTVQTIAHNQRLVAYIVPHQMPSPVNGLRTFLAERLPEYMLPAVFIPLDEMPLTPNGKINRQALPAPNATHFDVGQPYIAPRTATETHIERIWARALNLPRVSVHSHFLALGGHSLIATHIATQVRAQLAVNIPLSQLFEAATVAQMAALVDALRWTPVTTEDRDEGEL